MGPLPMGHRLKEAMWQTLLPRGCRPKEVWRLRALPAPNRGKILSFSRSLACTNDLSHCCLLYSRVLVIVKMEKHVAFEHGWLF